MNIKVDADMYIVTAFKTNHLGCLVIVEIFVNNK